MEFQFQIGKFSDLLQRMLESPRISFRDLKPTSLPASPGVYRIFETSAVFPSTVYVGESESLRNRIYRSHLMGNTTVSTMKRKLVTSGRYRNAADVKAYLRQDCSLQFLLVPSERERMRLEHFAVAMLGPYLND